eukprot:14946130-Alexandrium_andersonii.AAC.1
MSASLVGSEMCIRDSNTSSRATRCARWALRKAPHRRPGLDLEARQCGRCLLYTSDAADDM